MLLLHCAETPVSVFFPVGLSLMFFFFLLLVYLSQFPSQYPLFLCFSISIVSLSTLLVSLSLYFPLIFCHYPSFPLPFFPLVWVVFIGAGGARSILPRPIVARAWCARCLLFPSADSGGQCRRRLRGTAALASHHEMGGV